MLGRVSELADADFIRFWNAAASFDQAVERVRMRVPKAPQWSIVARASSLRRRGVELNHHESRRRTG
jgi:hypothetical protein